MVHENHEKVYRISIWPIFICFYLLWTAMNGIFLILKYIKNSEVFEMMMVGCITSIIFSIFVKWITKTVVGQNGIQGTGDDNKKYFVEWNKIERIKIKRFINLKYVVVYFNGNTNSIYIPQFIRRKNFFIEQVLKLAPPDNILKQCFEKRITKYNNSIWAINLDRENLLQQKHKAKGIFQGSVYVFYLITFFSVITTFINIRMHSNGVYVIGLGITKIISNFIITFPGNMNNIYKMSIIVDISIAWLFIFLAHYASKTYKWSFVTAIFIYGLDFLLLLSLRNYAAAIFHGFIIKCLFLGIENAMLLIEIEQQLKKTEPAL